MNDTPQVLMVDDEVNVLQAYRRTLGRKVRLVTGRYAELGHRVQALFQQWRVRTRRQGTFDFIDYLAIPFMQFANIRGNIFLDVGSAYYPDFNDDWECYNSDTSALEDCVASYGWGISFRLFGLELNWDFARRWNFSETLSDGFETSFWIGPRF